MLHDGKFEIKLGLPSGNAFPTAPAPAEGDIYYREDENRPYMYDGAAWHGLAQLDVAETISADWLFSGRLTSDEKFTLGTPTELTISGGVITITKSYHRVDTEGDDPADNLDTINGGVDGQLLILRGENDGRDVTIKHATGNISIDGSADRTFINRYQTILLIYDSTLSFWLELPRKP